MEVTYDVTRTEEEDEGDVNDAVVAGVVAGATVVVLAVVVLGVCRDTRERKCRQMSDLTFIFDLSALLLNKSL